MSTNQHEPTGTRPSQAHLRSVRRLTSRKGRKEQSAFIADGAQAVREAITYADSLDALYYVAGNPHAADFAEPAAAKGAAVYELTETEMTAITDTVTPQGIAVKVAAAAVERLWESRVTTFPANPRLVVVCDQIRDPGNLGTVIRCADAFGADAVIVTDNSVELLNPKTVRASVGSVFHLPLYTGAPLAEAVDLLRGKGLQLLAADGGGELLSDVDLTRPTAWVMGNEAWGLPAADRELADRVVGIPMWGKAESLNLATAAAVCLFATASAQRA